MSQKQFSREAITSASGRELVKTSFLGPFLSISVFDEDSSKVADKLFTGNPTTDKNINATIQQELESVRTILHKSMHSLLVNGRCRKPTLDYLAMMLKQNEKRAQLHTEEYLLAGDGFMLNLLSVLQKLSVQIKMDSVDPMFPFHPDSLVNIKNETRLKLTSQEAADWVASVEKSQPWKEAKFSTQCWFLTLHCHHIGTIIVISLFTDICSETFVR